MKHFKLNQKVKISNEINNDNYSEFVKKTLIITNVAKNKEDHRLYDDSVSPCYLYDLKTLDGEYVPFSLYDYELTTA